MQIIRESKGMAKDYAPLVLELYENKNGNAKPVKNALENLAEEAENALQHLDLLKAYNKARYGLINLLFNSNGKRLNIGEPQLFFGIESLKEANKLGIKTWVDLDPVIDPDQAFELIKKLHPYVNH